MTVKSEFYEAMRLDDRIKEVVTPHQLESILDEDPPRWSWTTEAMQGLICPVCAHNAQHLFEVGREDVAMPAGIPPGTSRTVDRMFMSFSCEEGHEWRLCAAEYKGTVMLWVESEDFVKVDAERIAAEIRMRGAE